MLEPGLCRCLARLGTGVLAEEPAHGCHGLHLAEVIANLSEPLPLLGCCLQKVLLLGFNELGKSLVGDPVRLVVPLPPLQLSGGHLVAFHVTLDFVNLADNLMCHLPVSCELVAVRSSGLSRGRKTLNEGLTINDQFNLLVGWHECLHQKQRKMLCNNGGTWVGRGH
jgi:hypothetical protein